MWTVNFESPARARQFGAELGILLRAGDVVCLRGELGAGKTTLVTGIAQGWGARDAVSSPTFVLVNEYHRADGQRLCHLDCYRLNSVSEAQALGFDDLLDSEDSVLIEWPERIAPLLPAEYLQIHLFWQSENERRAEIEAHGQRYATLLTQLKNPAALS
jgi:tRNA threonylcarbamoyladenosine biosynthesis protein TsaE